MCLETSTNLWHHLRPGHQRQLPERKRRTSSSRRCRTPSTLTSRCSTWRRRGRRRASPPHPACTRRASSPRPCLQNGHVIVIGGEYNVGTTVVGSMGTNGFAETNIGFIYDPVTNTWDPLDETNGGLGFRPRQHRRRPVFHPSQRNVSARGNLSTDLNQLNPLGGLQTSRVGTRPGSSATTARRADTAAGRNTADGTRSTRPVSVRALQPDRKHLDQPGTISPGTIPNMPVNLADFGTGTGNSKELGPSVMRPDGTVVWFSGGALGQNAVYNFGGLRREPGRTPPTWIFLSSTPWPASSTRPGTAPRLRCRTARLTLANPVSSTQCSGKLGRARPPPVCRRCSTLPAWFSRWPLPTTRSRCSTSSRPAPRTTWGTVERFLLLPTGEVLYTQMDVPFGVQVLRRWHAPGCLAPGHQHRSDVGGARQLVSDLRHDVHRFLGRRDVRG